MLVLKLLNQAAVEDAIDFFALIPVLLIQGAWVNIGVVAAQILEQSPAAWDRSWAGTVWKQGDQGSGLCGDLGGDTRRRCCE